LPKYKKDKPLYIGFFNTGAYQETIGGFGGLHHCLIPQPKHLLIDKDEDGNITTSVFSGQQTSEQMLSLLGYGNAQQTDNNNKSTTNFASKAYFL
jgi:arginine decarboxylase